MSRQSQALQNLNQRRILQEDCRKRHFSSADADEVDLEHFTQADRPGFLSGSQERPACRLGAGRRCKTGWTPSFSQWIKADCLLCGLRDERPELGARA